MREYSRAVLSVRTLRLMVICILEIGVGKNKKLSLYTAAIVIGGRNEIPRFKRTG